MVIEDLEDDLKCYNQKEIKRLQGYLKAVKELQKERTKKG
jgi:hypothetical protein